MLLFLDKIQSFITIKEVFVHKIYPRDTKTHRFLILDKSTQQLYVGFAIMFLVQNRLGSVRTDIELYSKSTSSEDILTIPISMLIKE